MNESAQHSGAGDSIGNASDLARQVRAGDRNVFQDLYDRVSPALYAWTRLRVRGSPAANLDPQDILQEVWLRALRGFESYDPERSFRAWILGITKNVLLHSYRSVSYDVLRGRVQSPTERQLEILNCPASVTSVSQRMGKNEAVQRFIAHVDELDPDDRLLVLYCGFEDYTCAEAATRLGISADAATKRWQKVRSRLRESGSCRALALEALE